MHPAIVSRPDRPFPPLTPAPSGRPAHMSRYHPIHSANLPLNNASHQSAPAATASWPTAHPHQHESHSYNHHPLAHDTQPDPHQYSAPQTRPYLPTRPSQWQDGSFAHLDDASRHSLRLNSENWRGTLDGTSNNGRDRTRAGAAPAEWEGTGSSFSRQWRPRRSDYLLGNHHRELDDPAQTQPYPRWNDSLSRSGQFRSRPPPSTTTLPPRPLSQRNRSPSPFHTDFLADLPRSFAHYPNDVLQPTARGTYSRSTESVAPKPLRRSTPTESYLQLVGQPSSRFPTPMPSSPSPSPHLLLMDLNGTLIFRPSKSNAATYRLRPFVGALLEYLRQSDRWEVGIWSSATGENVYRMMQSLGLDVNDNVDGLNNKGEEGIAVKGMKIVWARDTLLDKSSSEYRSKSATIKDLDIIFKHLNTLSPLRSTPYSPTNTLLLDDSHEKTACQPYNHVPVPDFDARMSINSARALTNLPDVPYDFATGPPGADRTLLAVIGILERAAGEDNLAGWIGARNLTPDQTSPEGRWWEGQDGSSVNLPSEMTKAVPISPFIGTKPHKKKLARAAQAPPLPPPQVKAWHEMPSIVDFWSLRGAETLKKMMIGIDHGMDTSFIKKIDGGLEERRRTTLAKPRDSHLAPASVVSDLPRPF